jgi:hypothetical protein
LDLSGSACDQVASCCECGNEPWDSIKRGEISGLAEEPLAFKEKRDELGV